MLGAVPQNAANGASGQQRTSSGGWGSKQAPGRQTVGFNVANERLSFIGSVLIGYRVEVQITGGTVYEGVFHSMQTDALGVSVVLRYAKVVKDPSASSAALSRELAQRPQAELLIPAQDLLQVFAKDVKMSPEDLAGSDTGDVGFETDAAISRGRGGGVRELQRWQPEEGEDALFTSLESSGTAGWDQFAVNRDKFGVETTWNELHYTTAIDRKQCGISDADAARIAKEIEYEAKTGMKGTSNIHLLEERGGELDANVDEEALYGAVQRQPMQQSGMQQQRSQQRASSEPRAWARMGSGVAAVAGAMGPPPPPPPPPAASQQPQAAQPQAGPPPPPPARPAAAAAAPAAAVPIPGASGPSGSGPAVAGGELPVGSAGASASAPIDIDPRKEVNKVRSSLTVGSKKDRSSPFGTPKLPGVARSPGLNSPLVADPVSLTALNLDPGAPPMLDPETMKEFLKFKQQQQNQDKAATDKPGRSEFAELKKSSFKDRAASSPPSDAPAAAVAAAAAAAKADAAPPAAAAAAVPAAPAAADVDQAKPAAAAAAPAAPAADGAAAEKPKPASKLNPNAKPFTLNINAKEFVPTFTPKPAAAAPAPAPVAAGAASGAAAGAAANGQPVGIVPLVAPVMPVVAAAAAVPHAVPQQQHHHLQAHHLQGGGPHGMHQQHQQHQQHQGYHPHAGGHNHPQQQQHQHHGHQERPMGGRDRDHAHHRNQGDGYRGPPGGGDHHPHKGDGHGGMHKGLGVGPQGPGAHGGPDGPVPIIVGPAGGAGQLGGPHHHGMMPMPAGAVAQGGMTTMPMPYPVMMAPAAGYVGGMPPGTMMAAPGGHGAMPMLFQMRHGSGPAMMAGPGILMSAGPGGPGMPYGTPVGAYMTSGGMPPPSPTGRPQTTGFFQPAGAAYGPMVAAQGMLPLMAPGGHGGHVGHGMQPHMQDGRMGMGGPNVGGGRQMGHRGGRPDYERTSSNGPSRDME